MASLPAVCMRLVCCFFVIGSRSSSALWYHSSFLSRRVAGLVSYRSSLFCVMHLALWPRFLLVICVHFVGFCYRVTLCLTLSCLGQFCASVTCSLRYLFCYAQGHGNLPTPLSRAEFFGYHAFELKFYLTTVSLCAVLVCVISRVPPFFVCSPFLSSLHLVSPSVHCEPTQARGVCSQLVQSPKPISSCLCFGWSALWLQIGVSPLQEIEVGHDKQTVSQAAS